MKKLICNKCDSTIVHLDDGLDGSIKIFCSSCGNHSPLYTFEEIDSDERREKPNHIKKKILLHAGDMMGAFLFYDRKFKTSDLSLNEVEESIIDGIISIDDIMDAIRITLETAVENYKDLK